MKRALLMIGAGAALGAMTISGSLAAQPETVPAPSQRSATAPAKPDTPGKPVTTPAGSNRSGMKAVIVSYVFRGTITKVPGVDAACTAATLGAGDFALDVANANKHARLLLAGAGVDMASSDVITVHTTAAGTAITRVGAAVEATDLQCGDIVTVIYRMGFRTTGRTTTGKPVSSRITNYTLENLQARAAKKVTVTTPAA